MNVAKAGAGSLGKAPVFTIARWLKRADGVYQLRQNLPKHQYEVPLAERDARLRSKVTLS